MYVTQQQLKIAWRVQHYLNSLQHNLGVWCSSIGASSPSVVVLTLRGSSKYSVNSPSPPNIYNE